MLDAGFSRGGLVGTSSDLLARRCAALLEARGINWRLLAAAHGLQLDGDPAEERRIPTFAKRGYIGAAVQLVHDPLFAWELGDVHLSELGLIGYTALHAPTVGEGLSCLVAALPSVCTAVFVNVVVDGDTASIVASTSDRRINSVLALRLMLTCLTDLTAPTFAPRRLGLALSDREYQPVVARQLAAPLRADELFAYVTFPSRHLRDPVAGADARLAAVLRPYWECQVRESRKRTDVVQARLEGAVIQTLHEGVPSLDRLAACLDMGRASLARDVAAIGGARLLIDRVRRRLAEELVGKPDMTLARIAAALGFSEPAALTHAYRRWTGRAPSSDRKIIVPAGFSLGRPDRVTADETLPA